MKCAKHRWCTAPVACGGFGYCRERNVAAGGMDHVTKLMQEEWEAVDRHGHEWGCYSFEQPGGYSLHATFATMEEARGWITEQPDGFCRFSMYELAKPFTDGTSFTAVFPGRRGGFQEALAEIRRRAGIGEEG